MNWLKKLSSRITPQELAQDELKEAERALLGALTGREYADSLVTYNEARVRRLKAFLEVVK